MGIGSLIEIGRQLEAIRGEMVDAERRYFARRPSIPDERRASAANLLHYLAMRSRDHRSLQMQLHGLGLSSLGRAEAQALSQVEAVLHLVRVGAARRQGALAVRAGRSNLERRARELFGEAPSDRTVRIMATVPTEAADDARLLHDLLASGMDCMRINTAHDDADVWQRMIANLRLGQQRTGRACRVLMDLAGPRLRTGPIEPGPPVLRWRPERDVYGRVLRPARVWLTAAGQRSTAPQPAAAVLPVGDSWLADVGIGERVRLTDARNKTRDLRIVAREPGGLWAESQQTAYVLPGMRLRRRDVPGAARETQIGALPATEQTIVLRPGDRLTVTRSIEPGRPAVLDAGGGVIQPAVIGVTLPALVDDARPGQAIWFDDGRIGGVIQEVGSDHLHVEIVTANPEGARLGAEKGINVPDTDLRLPALTAMDLAHLPFIAAHADMVGYSFVRTAADVEALQGHLAAASGPELGLILKIETKQAFEQLPSLLLAAMRSTASGVMIARGDLAVECGFERLAEVQEEILWLAEASHTPVIWATQVLEQLAKTGIASRAEVTDAAMGERAECVMLNKGPHITTAVRVLGDILSRMEGHQEKKSARLKPLRLADRFLTSLAAEEAKDGHSAA